MHCENNKHILVYLFPYKPNSQDVDQYISIHEVISQQGIEAYETTQIMLRPENKRIGSHNLRNRKSMRVDGNFLFKL